METSFPEYYEYYDSTCKSNMHLDGQNMQVNYFYCVIRLLLVSSQLVFSHASNIQVYAKKV